MYYSYSTLIQIEEISDESIKVSKNKQGKYFKSGGLILKFEDNVPIYQQIISFIKLKLMTEEWEMNQKLPSVREMAVQLGVNPNTIQRAYMELEREGYIYSKRGMGNFVTEDKEKIKKLAKDAAEKIVVDFILKMKKMGFNSEGIIRLIKEKEGSD